MCGICGEIRTRGDVRLSDFWEMTRSMQSRGPDSEGVFAHGLEHGSMAFGHRRLAILDQASTSQQPMIDNELGLGIVFNGCIYNFRELKSELQGKGYRFFSEGDTEVILKAYHAWGTDCVRRFKGMFAFALWERDGGRVVLVRDRLGIKPLYYTEGDGYFRFASSLPSLLAAGGVDRTLDPVALQQFFSFHAAVPAPRTILKSVKKLEPATILTIQPDGTKKTERYWHFTVGDRSGDRRLSEQEWSKAVSDAMLAAVDRRRVADVPVGVLLSGGLDSSLIVALLAKLGHGNVRTFSIGFESVGGQSGDEFYYSDIVAKHFGTEHEQIRIDGGEALGVLPDAIRAMSEPMVSHDSVAFYLLSREVAKRVRVVQSGQGADEIFGGYSWYPSFLTANDATRQYRDAYFDWQQDDLRKLLSDDVDEDHGTAFVESFFARTAATSAVDKALQIDAEIMLVDDPVKRVDNMTMAHGLEARVPFLDHEVVELAARMPSRLKVADGGKYILKQAARSLLPAEVIDRPKGYFPVPSLRHLRGEFLDYVRDVLNSPAARQRGLYRSEFIQHMLDEPEAEKSPKGHSRLWHAALLEAWLQEHAI
ncbi:N-acetylglutaminylglutamine amidotransferase [Rhodopseudomonas sp. HC1]|uniref:N-acetylglutaminylglutamine amidotransferase n=1 Tax=Rhodopseudomonas infernalis TaxID=2897386 RepID=UPI001EE97754|nr:N-acetylglutaminylglutamine amidotransferase [Rhodopseudomonas infernalis]MCG6206217.1 N-acetylglutaminylglutamine amidotransferase [Rhodopseudomonas infernalis]